MGREAHQERGEGRRGPIDRRGVEPAIAEEQLDDRDPERDPEGRDGDHGEDEETHRP
jgi:hypothetical protein